MQLLAEAPPLATSRLVGLARTRTGYVAQLVALGLLHYLGSVAAKELSPPHAPMFAASGIALAGLLLLGIRVWPAVAISGLFLNLLDQGSGVQALAASVAPTLGAVVPALILRRLGWNDTGFERLREVIRYVGVAAIIGPLVTVLSSSLVTTVISGGEQQHSLVLLTICLGSLMGNLLVGPLLLTWMGSRPTLPASAGPLERVALLAGIGGAALLSRFASVVYFLPTFPLLSWAGLRAGPRGTTMVSLALFIVTAYFTRGLNAQFAPGTDRLIFVAGLNMTQAVTALLLAASVAERRRSHQIERQVDGAYRTLVAAAPFGVIGLNRAGEVTVWSSAAEQIFGWRADEVLGRGLPTVPKDHEEEFARMLARPATINGFETVRRRKDGTELDISLTAWSLHDGEGRRIGAMGVLQDITERKRAARLQQAIYLISHAAMTAEHLDQLYTAIHGIVRELMPARNLYLALHQPDSDTLWFPYWSDERSPRPAARPTSADLTGQVLQSGRSLRVRASRPDTGHTREDGETYTDWLGVPLQVSGRTIGVLAVQSYDPAVRYTAREEAILEFVSSQVGMALERARAAEAVRRSEERFRLVASTTNDVVYEWDIAGDSDWWSDNMRQILGYEPSEVQSGLPNAWNSLLHPDDRLRVLQALDELIAQRAELWRCEYRLRRRDGSYAYVSDRGRVLLDPDGRPVRMLGAMRDITERREAEEALRRSEDQLRQSTKMEAIGRLAGGVAHDFNNLLTSVLGHAGLALGAVNAASPLRDDLLEIQAAGTRAAALTQQLLAFSRKQVLEPRLVDLNGVVAGIARMLRRTIGEDIELATRLAPDLGAVRADPIQMEQVLLNLAVNARDAMPHGGRLTIETSNVRLATGALVRVRVHDTGIGMNEEVRAHLFEPFYTTKDIGQGTGLGLATAYGIVQQSGGNITVTSVEGQGSTFVVDLPLVRGEPIPVEPPPVYVRRGGNETILLVEDEEAVRRLTRRVLELQGYQVLSAASGEAALALSRQHPAPIQLLLTDVVMPGISGPKLAEALLEERRGLRLIYMSGYAATMLERGIQLSPDTAFLQKPFTTEQLLRRVQDVLDAELVAGA